MHRLARTQRLPISLDEAWPFFCDPRNLAQITPPAMGFEVLTALPPKMYAGMIIEYTVRPMLGIPVHWVTEITHVEEKRFFVDEQRFGPYAFWHHQHLFTEVPGGVEMTDLVHYKLPFGPLGALLEPLVVAPKLKAIFDYRTRVLFDRWK
jgi:ligand-binding SRPBCC domain-containing protein